MEIGIIVSLFLLLLGFSNNKCCLGEIGTASSYGPPYTRKLRLDYQKLNLVVFKCNFSIMFLTVYIEEINKILLRMIDFFLYI